MTLLRKKHYVLIDEQWRFSILCAINQCATVEELRFVWQRWEADIRECLWRDEIVAAKDKRKGEIT